MNERINARTISTINLSRKLKLTQLMVFARVLDTGSFIFGCAPRPASRSSLRSARSGQDRSLSATTWMSGDLR
jgi:hypothetical protein